MGTDLRQPFGVGADLQLLHVRVCDLDFLQLVLHLSGGCAGPDAGHSALYSMLPFGAMTVCCLSGGVLNDAIAKRYGLRAGRCGLALVSLILTAVFLACGSRVASPMLASIVLAGGAGAIYLSQSSFWAVVADSAGAHTGVVSGVMNMGCQVGGALTASLTPWIAARFGWDSAFAAAAVLAVLGALSWAAVDPQCAARPAARATRTPWRCQIV